MIKHQTPAECIEECGLIEKGLTRRWVKGGEGDMDFGAGQEKAWLGGERVVLRYLGEEK